MNEPNLIPENETGRLEALKRLNILDTIPEKQFDDITRLASIICGMPMTLITLIDEERQWFKSKIGLDGTETPRNVSFCQHTILQNDIFEVENTLNDKRFSRNPFVINHPEARFYAGAPLRTKDGYNLGALCVIDTKPNKLTDNQKEALHILANEVITNMELRKEQNRITDEKQLLTESHELLNAFLENGPSLISMKDTDGRYIYLNSNATKSIGKNLSELLGKTSHEISKKELADEVVENDKNVKQTKRTIRKEYIVGEGSNERHFVSYTFPLLNPEKEVYGVGTVSNDVTEAKKLELSLKQSKERFLKIFNDSPVGMTLVNTTDRTLLSVNKSFLEIFKFDAEESVIGKTSTDLGFITPEEISRISVKIKDNGFLLNEEITCNTIKNEQLTAMCSANLLEMDGENVFLISYIDITERKKLELQLIEAKKIAEQATLSKSSFLANMSHEIRTPLNAMLGFSDLLERTKLDPQQKEYLEAIDTSGKNLLTIINDILDFSKIEAGMLNIEKIPFSPHQLIHSVHTMFFNKAKIKNIKLFIFIDPTLPEMVKGDPTRLTQILINLIGNAIKFTNEGSVSLDCEVLNSNEQAVKIKVSVKDTGIGIAPEKLNTIFERFTQAESDTNRSYGGTGLGLSIAKKLLELQGGEIMVNSTPGKGSEFSFLIEYTIADEKILKQNNNTRVDKQDIFKGKKVLVVEDNVLNQKLAQAILSGEGFEVKIAENGQVAVDLLKEQAVDFILMDIQMPVMDGYQATKAIRHDLEISTPIIAMTANAMAGEREKCINSGMDDYITKPFNPDVLFGIMKKLLNTGSSNSKLYEERLTDLTYLRGFSGGKDSFVKDILNLFLEQNPVDVKALEEAIRANDLKTIKSIAHSLQTSLGFIGFKPSLINFLKEAEVNITDGKDIEQTKSNMLTIIECCKQAQEELKEELSKL